MRPLYLAARREGWRVEPLGLTRAVMELRGHGVVHAHDARTHTMATLLRGRPLVVARRVAFPVGSRWKYGKARRYIAVSEFVKGVLIEGGVPAEKISVVYDGVPVLEVSRGTGILRLEKGRSPVNLEAALAEAGDRGLRDRQRGSGIGSAAGDVGGNPGGGERRGRAA